MNVRQIVKQYLKKNGYDGLYSNGDCCCITDDLMLCDEGFCFCFPGYLCARDSEEYEYCIGPEKYHESEKQV